LDSRRYYDCCIGIPQHWRSERFPHCTRGVRAIFLHQKSSLPLGSHLCFLYPMSRCSQPGHVFTTSHKGLLDTRAALPLPVSSVFLCYPSQTGSFHDPEELKHCSECSQDNLRIITPPHTPSAYVPSYIVTTRYLLYLTLPILPRTACSAPIAFGSSFGVRIFSSPVLSFYSCSM
jgi:hypothetical protein